jgi:hypothetical protein
VEVKLSEGSLRAGKAHVRAEVTNNGQRSLLGLRIAAYYDPLDALPAPDAPWRLHEFLFEPPLLPGATLSVTFSDENASEYVLLRCAYARFTLGIIVNTGQEYSAAHELLESDGLQYIATRDLATALGATVRQQPDKQVVLGLPDGSMTLVFRPGSQQVRANGEARSLSHPTLEREGRSWLPLHEVCLLLGFEADYELAANILRLSLPDT